MIEGQQQQNQDFQNYGYSINNQGYNSASALQTRLDISVIDEFEKYLRGMDVRLIQGSDGKLEQKVIWKGKRIVNDLGYQTIMQWLNGVINKATMQANFITEDDYSNFMCDLHKDMAEDLLINRVRYELSIKDFQALLHKFIMCSRLILTRPIFNKERDGMNNTVRTQETVQTSSQRPSFFNVPFFGGKK